MDATWREHCHNNIGIINATINGPSCMPIVHVMYSITLRLVDDVTLFERHDNK